MDPLASSGIDDFDGVVAECGHEKPPAVGVEKHVIDSALDIGDHDCFLQT